MIFNDKLNVLKQAVLHIRVHFQLLKRNTVFAIYIFYHIFTPRPTRRRARPFKCSSLYSLTVIKNEYINIDHDFDDEPMYLYNMSLLTCLSKHLSLSTIRMSTTSCDTRTRELMGKNKFERSEQTHKRSRSF